MPSRVGDARREDERLHRRHRASPVPVDGAGVAARFARRSATGRSDLPTSRSGFRPAGSAERRAVLGLGAAGESTFQRRHEERADTGPAAQLQALAGLRVDGLRRVWSPLSPPSAMIAARLRVSTSPYSVVSLATSAVWSSVSASSADKRVERGAYLARANLMALAGKHCVSPCGNPVDILWETCGYVKRGTRGEWSAGCQLSGFQGCRVERGVCEPGQRVRGSFGGARWVESRITRSGLAFGQGR